MLVIEISQDLTGSYDEISYPILKAQLKLASWYTVMRGLHQEWPSTHWTLDGKGDFLQATTSWNKIRYFD